MRLKGGTCLRTLQVLCEELKISGRLIQMPPDEQASLAKCSPSVSLAPMIRISDEKVKRIALRILEGALREGIYQPVPRSLGIRLALAYLSTLPGSNREPFDEFWRALPLRDDLSRSIMLKTALLDIRYRVGAIDEREFVARKTALPVPTKKGWR